MKNPLSNNKDASARSVNAESGLYTEKSLDLPEFGTVLRCRFPESENPLEPGGKARSAVVVMTLNREQARPLVLKKAGQNKDVADNFLAKGNWFVVAVKSTGQSSVDGIKKTSGDGRVHMNQPHSIEAAGLTGPGMFITKDIEIMPYNPGVYYPKLDTSPISGKLTNRDMIRLHDALRETNPALAMHAKDHRTKIRKNGELHNIRLNCTLTDVLKAQTQGKEVKNLVANARASSIGAQSHGRGGHLNNNLLGRSISSRDASRDAR